MNKYWLAFWTTSFIYGSSFGLNRVLLRDIHPIQLGFVRYIIAALGLNLILLVQGKHLPHNWRMLRNLAIAGTMNHGIPFILIAWAQTHIDSGLASVFLATAPIYSLILAHFVYDDERMSLSKVMGICLGFVGIIILSSRHLAGASIGSDFTAELVILFAAILTGSGMVFSRYIMRGEIDTMVMATGTMTTGAIFTLLMLLILPSFRLGTVADYATNVSITVTLLLLVNGLFNTLFANILFYFALGGLGASRTSLITYVVPPISLVLGAIFLEEIIDLSILLGTVLILSGLALTNLATITRPYLQRHPAEI